MEHIGEFLGPPMAAVGANGGIGKYYNANGSDQQVLSAAWDKQLGNAGFNLKQNINPLGNRPAKYLVWGGLALSSGRQLKKIPIARWIVKHAKLRVGKVTYKLFAGA